MDRAARSRAGVFDSVPEAGAEASRRADLTRRRYRVRFEPNNRQWNITETHHMVRAA